MFPHGYCIGSLPLILVHALADMSIFVAYVSISLCLLYYRKFTDVFRPSWVTIAFAIFIFSCGLTHLMDALVLWVPWYRMQAGVKVLCALSSMATAAAMPKAIHDLLVKMGGEIGREQ